MQRLAIGCLCLILAGPLFAEELQIPIGQQGDKNQQRPSSGMSTDDVEAKYGAPENVEDPIGDPPITKWVYKDFSVYFEYNLVVHSVLHK